MLEGLADPTKAQAESDAVAKAMGVDVVASYETLRQYFVTDATTLRAGFRPLRPDPEQLLSLRSRYALSGRRLVGICWRSTNAKKDLPALPDWARFLRSLNASFVSLQYGEVSDDISTLRSLSEAEIIADETINSLADLDGFAAQVAAMDEVVTISNTGAHMAGALGMPTTILLDDKVHLIWPVKGKADCLVPIGQVDPETGASLGRRHRRRSRRS